MQDQPIFSEEHLGLEEKRRGFLLPQDAKNIPCPYREKLEATLAPPARPDLLVGCNAVFFSSSETMDQIRDASIDLVFTSPPYWNLKDYGHDHQIGQEEYDVYLERLNSVWREAYRVTKDNGLLVINVGNRRVNKRYIPLAMDIYKTITDWVLLDTIIWYKPNALPQPASYINRLFDDKFEYVLVFGKSYDYNYTFNKIRVPQKYAEADPREHKKNPSGRCIGNVWRIPAYRPPNIKQLGYHIAAFPEELAYMVIYAFTNPGDVVLDPFLGSGTTLKVAAAISRIGVGYEINAQYASLIQKRIEEPWDPPPFTEIDIIHGTTAIPGRKERRRPKASVNEPSLF